MGNSYTVSYVLGRALESCSSFVVSYFQSRRSEDRDYIRLSSLSVCLLPVYKLVTLFNLDSKVMISRLWARCVDLRTLNPFMKLNPLFLKKTFSKGTFLAELLASNLIFNTLHILEKVKTVHWTLFMDTYLLTFTNRQLILFLVGPNINIASKCTLG